MVVKRLGHEDKTEGRGISYWRNSCEDGETFHRQLELYRPTRTTVYRVVRYESCEQSEHTFNFISVENSCMPNYYSWLSNAVKSVYASSIQLENYTSSRVNMNVFYQIYRFSLFRLTFLCVCYDCISILHCRCFQSVN